MVTRGASDFIASISGEIMRFRQCLFTSFAFVFLLIPQLNAQQITGRVINAAANEPLGAVQVFIAGSGVGALSQQNGRFLLLNVPVGTHTLTAQRIGFQSVSREVTVAAGETVVQDFQLREQALGLDEIIVTGTPGGTQRRAIGNSVVSVDAAAVTEQSVIVNMANMLQGRNAGVTMGNAGGAIGTGADISIRGYGSFSRDRSQPLLYVDGVRVNNNTQAGPKMAGGRQSNVLNDFDPDDIESIEIIKGPAAATLYGSEASAGVIQIITKRGSEGAPQFSASIAEGRNFIRGPQNKWGTQWACTGGGFPCKNANGDLDVAGVVPYSWLPNMNQALHDGGFNQQWNHDNYETQNVLQYGPSRSYNLAVRGGTQTIRYFLSGNYDYNEGSVYWNHDKAVRMRANIGVVFSENFTADISTAFTRGATSYAAQVGTRGGLWDQVTWGQGYCAPFVSPNPDVGCARKLGMQQFVPSDIPKVKSTRDYDRFTGSLTLNFTTGDRFTSRAVFGFDGGWDKNEKLHPIETVLSSAIQQTLDGQVVYETPRNADITVDWSSTFSETFGPVSTATSFGAQYFSREFERFSIEGNGLASPLSQTINQTPITRNEVTYDFEQNKSVGVYVQEQLGLNDRFFVTGALRFDDNSAFGTSFDPVIYPKLSGTWVLSEEAFWNIGFVDNLRIRGAWGKAGQQPSTFASVNTFDPIAGPGGTSALEASSIGNPDVGPEKSTELELGFDISALEGRISGEFSWYQTQSIDNLLDIALPMSVGGGGDISSNVGVIDKWGWEATVATRLIENDNLEFGIDFNAALTRNEIMSLGDFPGEDEVKVGFTFPGPGQFGSRERYSFVSAKFSDAGTLVDPYGRKIEAFCDQGVSLDPNNPIPVAGSQYGVITGGATVPCSDITGEIIVGGKYAYAPWNFSIMPNITLGGGALRISTKFDGQYGKRGNDRMKLWHHIYNTDIGTITQDDPLYYASYRLSRSAQYAYFDADFWKLREVSVRYQLPESVASRIGADRASIGFSGRELAVLWWDGGGALGLDALAPQAMQRPASVAIDPEHGRGQLGNGGHRTSPGPSSFHLRLDVTF